jgi:hypothetical protein
MEISMVTDFLMLPKATFESVLCKPHILHAQNHCMHGIHSLLVCYNHGCCCSCCISS